MKIAQIAPVYESVSPKLYGRADSVMSYLTDELVDKVTKLFFLLREIQIRLQSWFRLFGSVEAEQPGAGSVGPSYYIVQMQKVYERLSEFEVLHFHTAIFIFLLRLLAYSGDAWNGN